MQSHASWGSTAVEGLATSAGVRGDGDADDVVHPYFKTRVCKYWAQNKCVRGHECSFAHLDPNLLKLSTHIDSELYEAIVALEQRADRCLPVLGAHIVSTTALISKHIGKYNLEIRYRIARRVVDYLEPYLTEECVRSINALAADHCYDMVILTINRVFEKRYLVTIPRIVA